MTIGERIKVLRKTLNLTQEQFANSLGVDQGHIAGIEKGSRNPSKPLFKLICMLHYVNDIWLTMGEGEMFIDPEEIIEKAITRFGEQPITEILKNTLRLASVDKIDDIPYNYCVYDKDPELKRMINTLFILFATGDERLKNWASIQFDRAFPHDMVEEAQKKHGGGSSGPATANSVKFLMYKKS
jgi:transcriptional regulator with XRE-family HTH domain